MTQFTIMGASVMARDSIMGASVMAQVPIMGAIVMARDSWLQADKHWMVHVHGSTLLEFFQSHSMSLVLTA